MKTIKYKGKKYKITEYTSCNNCELKKDCSTICTERHETICQINNLKTLQGVGEKVRPLRLKWKHFIVSFLIAAAIIISFLIIILAGFKK